VGLLLGDLVLAGGLVVAGPPLFGLVRELLKPLPKPLLKLFKRSIDLSDGVIG
jgi:hypothetical protein